MLATDTISGKEISTNLRPLAEGNSSLQLLYVTKDDGAVEYLYARTAAFLSSIPRSSTLNRSDISFRPASLPSVTYQERSPIREKKLTATAYYALIDPNQLFLIFRSLFIATLVFAVLLIILLGTQKLSNEEVDVVGRKNGSKPQILSKERHTEETETKDAVPDTNETGVSLYSPRSGLCWEDFLTDRLTNELKRSASFEQELSLAIVDCGPVETEAYRHLADEFSRIFPMRDMTFEFGVTSFALILPNTPLLGALDQLKVFLDKIENEKRVSLFAGLSSRSGRLIEGELLIKEASVALKRAKSDMESNIIGFRPDPGKFREYLAKKGSVPNSGDS